MQHLPQISLISSWHVPEPASAVPLAGLTYGLRSGIGTFDLYFLLHCDLEWYVRESGLEETLSPEEGARIRSCPLYFAATLTGPAIRKLAEALTGLMTGEFSGRLVGPRPRFAALATHWPGISSPAPESGTDPDPRELSIRALRNSLLLAAELGVRHVEMVGGSAFGLEDLGRSSSESYEENARTGRMALLSDAVVRVYEGDRGFGDLASAPSLCVEIEPGKAYLINGVDSYRDLKKQLRPFRHIAAKVLLNVDIAHMFLVDAGLDPQDENSQYSRIRYGGLMTEVGHFHISDHARSHAADLCPGRYHFENDYRPWLEMAAELMNADRYPAFSRSIAVEMEACADVREVISAIGLTRHWIEGIAPAGEETSSHSEVKGVLLSVDIAGSTSILALEGTEVELGARRINAAVSALCRVIHNSRGSVYSFTGDGVLAVFEYRDFRGKEEAAASAFRAALQLRGHMLSALEALLPDGRLEQDDELALRICLHEGTVMIPTHGRLADQVMGTHVIIVCRMLEYAEQDLTRHKPSCGYSVVVSGAVHALLAKTGDGGWRKMDPQPMRGISDAVGKVRIRGVFRWVGPPAGDQDGPGRTRHAALPAGRDPQPWNLSVSMPSPLQS